MIHAHGYAAQNATSPLAPWSFDRRDLGPTDVQVEIQYCGVCHSDIHQARNEWGGSTYPMVPGHEIVGTVRAVGSAVKKFKVGDLAGVGVMVDSCRECNACREGEEQYCERAMTVWTYNGKHKDGTPSQGGYSNVIVTDEAFTLKISPKLNLPAVAPLLCAGITTYSPLKRWGVGKGSVVGVVGLGGLGHMALKFAHAFGADVTQFTTSPSKEEDARKLGADHVILTKEPRWEKKIRDKFDFIIDTVSGPHDLNPYLGVLKRNGAMVQVGIPDKPSAINMTSLMGGRKCLSASAIGGMAQTQEMLDFCAANNIVADIEMIAMDQINEAFERVVKADVKYRFVIDLKTLKN